MRRFAIAAAMLGVLWAAPSAQAAIPDVFGGTVTCSVDGGDGVRECGNSSPRSTTPTWDGVPLDINVAFPPDPGAGDGNFPLIMWGHGYGGAKIGFGTSGSTTSGMRRFTSRGFAVMSMTTRGFRESCGSSGMGSSQEAAGAACNNGYVRLMDTRYEVRDYQYLSGLLADEERIDPQRLGAFGTSYGGGLSMALAALRNRVMLPDGSLIPWVSTADNDPMQLAAAAPNIPWSDLVYSLVPNGRTLDYVTDSPYGAPIGVMKHSLVNGLYTSGQSAPGLYAGTPPAPADPDADLTGWLARLQAGEPYDGDPLMNDIVDEIKTHHSSYYINDSVAPPPMLISSGFTDDLFPADEAIRYYNRTRERHPNTPMSLFFGNFGHQRAQNRAADAAVLTARENAWFDFYLRGVGGTPFQGVEATNQVCPTTAPSEGPFPASNWARMAPGEIRHFDGTRKTIAPNSGSNAIGATFNPALNNQPCGTAPGADQNGVASYRLPVQGGFVMIGSPTVIADITSSPNSQISARLLDIQPDGTEILVNRAIFRPTPGTSRQVFQLHPNGYRFPAGHIVKLELLPKDGGGAPLTNYSRPSNGQAEIAVDDLQLRLPVLSRPGAQNGFIGAHAKYIVPAGQKLAKDFADLGVPNASFRKGKLKADAKKIKGTKVRSPQDWEAAHVSVEVLGGGGGAKKGAKKKKKAKPLAKGKATVAGGKTKKVTLKLTKTGKKKLAGRDGKAKVKLVLTSKEQEGKVTVKRTLLLG